MNLCSGSAKADFLSVLLLGMALLAGCDGPEMPMPPPRESTNPAEDDFAWAMERLEHALTMFQPPSSLGLSVKRGLDYKLILPTDDVPNYTARVTISTRSTFNHGVTSSAKERKQAERKKAAAQELKLDDPYALPGENSLDADELGIKVPAVDLPEHEVPEPNIPTQKLEEKKDYLLEYIDTRWQLQTEGLETNERLWFDYALETGEYGAK